MNYQPSIKKMNINRHNYEEYFLLYVDHELTAAERMMVEEFVAANPDLKAELELLAQTTYAADAQLDNDFKAQLLKPVEQEITRGCGGRCRFAKTTAVAATQQTEY